MVNEISATETICDRPREPLPIGEMDNEPWQRRLKEVGVKQADFARFVGLTPTNLSEGLRGRWKTGVPVYLQALIEALEIMSPEQRTEWIKRRTGERSRGV